MKKLFKQIKKLFTCSEISEQQQQAQDYIDEIKFHNASSEKVCSAYDADQCYNIDCVGCTCCKKN